MIIEKVADLVGQVVSGGSAELGGDYNQARAASEGNGPHPTARSLPVARRHMVDFDIDAVLVDLGGGPACRAAVDGRTTESAPWRERVVAPRRRAQPIEARLAHCFFAGLVAPGRLLGR